jgi:hypothetical protein
MIGVFWHPAVSLRSTAGHRLEFIRDGRIARVTASPKKRRQA